MALKLYVQQPNGDYVEREMAQDNTCATFQVGDIVTKYGDDEYEVLALWPCHGTDDTMTLRCIKEGEEDPYMTLGEEYDCCKCRRFDLKRRSQRTSE